MCENHNVEIKMENIKYRHAFKVLDGSQRFGTKVKMIG